MQCEGTFVSEAWRLCSGAVHLQLDEHLTPESFYTELPRAFAQAHIWTQKKTHRNAFHRNPVAHGTSPLLRTASCESACMCLCACEAVMTFRDCLPHSVSLSFTPSFLYLILPPILFSFSFLKIALSITEMFSPSKACSSLAHVQFILKHFSPFLPPPHQKQLAFLLFLVFPTACPSLSLPPSAFFSRTLPLSFSSSFDRQNAAASTE